MQDAIINIHGKKIQLYSGFFFWISALTVLIKEGDIKNTLNHSKIM